MLPLILTLVGELPTVLEAASKIKTILLANGSNFVIQIQQIQTNAVQTADATLQAINDWESKNTGAAHLLAAKKVG